MDEIEVRSSPFSDQLTRYTLLNAANSTRESFSYINFSTAIGIHAHKSVRMQYRFVAKLSLDFEHFSVKLDLDCEH